MFLKESTGAGGSHGSSETWRYGQRSASVEMRWSRLQNRWRRRWGVSSRSCGCGVRVEALFAKDPLDRRAGSETSTRWTVEAD